MEVVAINGLDGVLDVVNQSFPGGSSWSVGVDSLVSTKKK